MCLYTECTYSALVIIAQIILGHLEKFSITMKMSVNSDTIESSFCEVIGKKVAKKSHQILNSLYKKITDSRIPIKWIGIFNMKYPNS